MASDNGQLKPTPAADWRRPREEGYTVELLTGKVATLRPVALDVLLAEGEIPNMLRGLATQTLWEGPPDLGDPEGDKEARRRWYDEMAEIMPDTMRLYNLICKAAFLHPKVVDDPQGDDEISVEDIEVNDKMLVFQVVTQGVQTLRKFRDGQAAGLEPVSDGDEDEPAPEPIDGD